MKTIILLLFSLSVQAQSIDQVQVQVDKPGSKVKMTKPNSYSKPPSVKQNQKQQQQQAQQQVQTAVSSSDNIGNDQSMSYQVEAGAPDIVLVPNNNTSNCQRVYGISFSTQEGGAGAGWPYRDKDCDFEQAADDAAANGQHTIAWFWRCHKKALYKQFNGRAKHKEQQIQECHKRMMGMFVKEEPPILYRTEPKPPVVVNCETRHPETHERIFEACQEK